MAFGIKRGATLLFAIQFTQEEWALIAPITEAKAYCRVEGERYQLTVTINPTLRALVMRAETGSWKLGKGEMDAMLIYGGKTVLIPELSNIDMPVLEGVSL